MPFFTTQNRLLIVTYGLIALLFAKLYFLTTTEWRQAPLELLVSFQAERPFQERVLLPWLIGAINQLIGLTPLTIFPILTVAVTFGIILSFRQLLIQLGLSQIAPFGAIAIIYPMLWNYCVYGIFRTPYDLPAILFFTTGLVLLLQHKWWLFYLCFILGAFNRETIILLSGAYILLFIRTKPPWTIVSNVSAQLVIWLSIKVSLGTIFAANPGSLFQLQLQSNIDNILHGRVLTHLGLMYGGAWVVLLLFWRQQVWVVKRIIWLAVPYYALMALIGNLHELRIYNEFIPIISLALVSTFSTFVPPQLLELSARDPSGSSQPPHRSGGTQGA